MRVTVDRQPVRLTTGRLRTVLAVLALSAGDVVSVDRLIGAVWADGLPTAPTRSLQTYVARLRTVVGAERIQTHPAGYLLHTDPGSVDALRFDELLKAAAAAADTSAEHRLLTEARLLWRGDPFSDIRSDWLEREAAVGLQERYIAAAERCADLDLLGGRHQDAVLAMGELTARYPLRESLWVRLLAALDLGGRHAEALERFEEVRHRLAEELGTDPGPRLRAMHADLLAAKPVSTGVDVPARVTRPRQLPINVAAFIGRATELAALDELGAGTVAVITGAAGVGKTALAVHWAHRAAQNFPDGQLYLDLQGFGPSGATITPAQAVRRLLHACGVPAERIPADLDNQFCLYRSVLADKRMLILLDNAGDASGVRPLLPGNPGCATVVTSRNQLTGLIAAEGARAIRLGLLSTRESRDLVTARIGRGRPGPQIVPCEEAIRMCAGLPLALSNLAARVAFCPELPLSTQSVKLHDKHPGLDLLDSQDDGFSVRTGFSWSYQAVSSEAAQLFRRLGLHTGPDLSVSAAGALAGIPRGEAKALLGELERTNLITPQPGNRYRLHVLLRRYAAELTERHDTTDQRRAAVLRLLDHYLHTAAARTLEPATVAGPDTVADEGSPHWFTIEQPNLLAAVELARANGFDAHARALTQLLSQHTVPHEG